MNWKKIDNSVRIQNKGVYNDWKQQIADDCYNQCVYCSIHEGPWGGIDHYHIDHFRPKSKFSELEHIISNLYYSCPVCNRFKSDSWENEPDDLNQICYPDPSEYDYSELFTMNNSFILEGKYTSSKYVVNRLFLNRAQLIYERREHFLLLKGNILIEEIKKNIKKIKDQDLIIQALDRIASLTQFLMTKNKVVPYKLLEIKKA